MFKYLAKQYYRLRDARDYLRAFRKRETSGFRVEEVVSHSQLIAAKKLHASVYLDRGFIDKNDISGGILTKEADPHQKHSHYFVVVETRTGCIVATARQIEVRAEYGHNSFAIVHKADLYERAKKTIAKHDPAKIIEISGLAKKRGISKIVPLLLYRAMWHRSLRQRHTLWLLACDTRLFLRLKLLFGSSINRIGRVTPYYGGDIVPAMIDVQGTVRNLERSLERTAFLEGPLRHHIARFMLNRLPFEHLNDKEELALKRIVEKYKPFYSKIGSQHEITPNP